MIISFILAILGLIAIFLEFWLPGGIAAFFGVVLLGGSLFEAFRFDWRFGVVLTQFEIMAIIVLVRSALKSLQKRKVCLSDNQENFKGCYFKEECIGKEGAVIKDLKPSGVIEIDGEHFSALSDGDYLKKGTKVTVIGGEGFHLIVR